MTEALWAKNAIASQSNPRSRAKAITIEGIVSMTPLRSDQGDMRMSEIEFQVLLTRAAEEGAKRALADAGIDGKDAALDIRDLRSLLDCIRFVRRTAVQTAVHLITTGLMLALLAGIAIKLKIFGGGP
jgi:hypothetical protein